jgi:hypothetical protein
MRKAIKDSQPDFKELRGDLACKICEWNRDCDSLPTLNGKPKSEGCKLRLDKADSIRSLVEPAIRVDEDKRIQLLLERIPNKHISFTTRDMIESFRREISEAIANLKQGVK